MKLGFTKHRQREWWRSRLVGTRVPMTTHLGVTHFGFLRIETIREPGTHDTLEYTHERMGENSQYIFWK